MRSATFLVTNLVLGIVAAGLLGSCLNSEEPVGGVLPPKEHKWFVEVGPFWRTGGDVDFRVKSLPSIPYTRPSAVPSGKVGPADRVADREYNDGYVRMDYGTGVWDTDTWYWGYQNAGQVAGNQLVFHGSTLTAGGQTISPRDRFSLDLDDEFGVEGRIGRSIFDSKCLKGSILLGVGFTSFGGNGGFDDLGYVWSSQGGIITDYYDLCSEPSLVPPPPYSGTKDGPGYIIPNIPAKREIRGGAGSGPPLTQIFHSVREDIDVDLWVLSLSLDVRGKARVDGEKRFISYVLGAGLTGNFVSADSDFRWAAMQNGAAIDSASFSGDDSTFELGLYGEAGILFHLCERVSVSLRGRYDYVFDAAEVSFPNTNAEIDLSGVSAVAGIGISL